MFGRSATDPHSKQRRSPRFPFDSLVRVTVLPLVEETRLRGRSTDLWREGVGVTVAGELTPEACRAAFAFTRRPTAWLDRGCLRGLPVLVHEVSRRVWGLRLRRTEHGLAFAPVFMLPSAHYKDVGVRIASFRSSIPTPPIPLFTLHRAPRDAQRKTRGRVDR
jgi:hypothetical protein